MDRCFVPSKKQKGGWILYEAGLGIQDCCHVSVWILGQ